MIERTIQQLKIAVLLLVGVIIFGMAGFMVIEGWNFFDAIYMTIISITTTGYREVHPLSSVGKIFTLFVIIFGVVAIAYIGGRLAQFFVEAYVFRRRKMEKKLKVLSGHYIICGYGRMGKKICEELSANKASFVVIENDNKEIENLSHHDYIYIQGDATDDETLQKACIKEAKGMVAVLRSEAENVF
ncbi:MAG: potassium channel protein, partial [Calditrichae bacterium]|nr:potassium channel protein [Calditrichia bacterium]